MSLNESNYGRYVGAVLICIICLWFFKDGINSIQYQLIGYDEGYNATVAANVVRYGQYKVSYPADIVFYNKITTGMPVILPTALLYKIFGINNITTSIVSLTYCTLSIICIFWLFCRCFKGRKGSCMFSAFLAAYIIMTEGLFQNIATHLMGEGASLFFLLIACLFLSYGFEKKKNMFFFGSGFLVSASFLTKSAMIFFVVTFMGVLILETILVHRIALKQLIGYVIGQIIGIVLPDMYKVAQLGGIRGWLQWWKDEWNNMLNQSSGIDLQYDIQTKFKYLASIFGINRYLALLMILAPIGIYGYYLWMKLVRKKTVIDARFITLLMGGLGGASLEVYFLLLGGGGLVYSRRHIVNVLFVKCLIVFVEGLFVYQIVDFFRKKYNDRTKGLLLTIAKIAVVFFSLIVFHTTVYYNVKNYITVTKEDSYELKLMHDFLIDVDHINDSATLYCYGWWQEPNVTLFLERIMVDISQVTPEDIDTQEGYLIIGRRLDNWNRTMLEENLGVSLHKINDIYVNYDKLNSYNSDMLFSIYKIESY